MNVKFAIKCYYHRLKLNESRNARKYDTQFAISYEKYRFFMNEAIVIQNKSPLYIIPCGLFISDNPALINHI